MPRLTVTITDEQAALLDAKTGEGGEYESKSEAVRTFIHEYEHLTERVDDLEIENDRLRRQLAATNQRIDEHQELVEYVEEERRDRQRDRERRNAPVWRRAKWWVLGAPDDGGEGSEQGE